MIAMREATDWCSRWWNSRRFHRARDRRMETLTTPGWATHRDDPRPVASSYPDIVALTGLLASPTLRSLPFTGTVGNFRRFIKEVRERAAPGYRYEGAGAADPLVRWIEEERYYRTLLNHPWPMPNEPRTHEPKTLDDLARRVDSLLARGDRRRFVNCGDRFEATYPTARFCSISCRSRNWRLQQIDRASGPAESMKCPVCGVTWTAGNDRRQGARYCSHR
ncbi:hypothetical protein [Streptomyces sp. NBC_01481]|uniref:hypothetical protein n=1 Tax=Streptomyces sp. NBC_01481 TaxID=2975869 RepID=UPI00225A7F47|nr:hypothetical protein [Streptomyces sp. NBC_01481]MCX4586354.1 hypothetical protein [Streptomyces sp. NBC_01481]